MVRLIHSPNDFIISEYTRARGVEMSDHDTGSEAEALDDYDDDDFAFVNGNHEEGGEFVIFPNKLREEATQALRVNRTALVEDTRTQDEVIADMKARYVKAKAAKVGDTIECACCAKKIVKTSYQMAFCSNGKNRRNILLGNNNCKDRFWNLTSDKRRPLAIKFLEKRDVRS
jgi:hypothetical protein